MRSISSGGQPCRVDRVMDVQMWGLMASMYAASTPGRRSRFSFAQAVHSAHTALAEASFMPSMYLSTFSL